MPYNTIMIPELIPPAMDERRSSRGGLNRITRCKPFGFHQAFNHTKKASLTMRELIATPPEKRKLRLAARRQHNDTHSDEKRLAKLLKQEMRKLNHRNLSDGERNKILSRIHGYEKEIEVVNKRVWMTDAGMDGSDRLHTRYW